MGRMGSKETIMSKKIMGLVKGVWAFCSYLFWPRSGGINEKLKVKN